MLLAQHFGSSRFVSKTKVNHVYGKDGGYDCEVVGYDLTLDELADSEMSLFDAIEFLNRPAAPDFIAKNIARLRTVMARAAESNQDITILIDTYSECLAQFPPDVVKAICDKIMNERKWFPLISEMSKDMLALVSYRRALLKMFEEKRNPLLANKRAAQIEADPRLGVHWKYLAQNVWLPQHYDWWVGEAEDMLRMATEMPAFVHRDVWEPELQRRIAIREKAVQA